MKTWKVMEIGNPRDVLRLNEIKVPELPDNMVLLKVQFAALNFFDILQCKGEYQEKHETPLTIGAECSAIVVNPGNSDFKKGDKVIAIPTLPNGAYTEYLIVEKERVYKIPDEMDLVDASAMFITFQTSYYALTRCCQLKKNEILLVHAGTGGVGSAAIQIGKAMGAVVIATAGSDEKTKICKEIGADYTINYQTEDFVSRVKDITKGKCANVIFDPVGGEVFDKSRKAIAFEGRILTVGFAGGTIPIAPVNHLLVKNYSVIGVHWGLFLKKYPEEVIKYHNVLMEMYKNRKLKPLIYHIYKFEELIKALEDLSTRKTWGKALINVNKAMR